MDISKQREIWIDNVKVVACVLVVIGHFFMSMVTAGILSGSDLYQWARKTIYYFHVPLFFICSGYLYQKRCVVNDIHSWRKNVVKKLLHLGIPYFIFSFITWLLKTMFSGSVNTEIGGLFDTLFLHPTSPYWYLYALFFLFLMTPTFKNQIVAYFGLAVALGLKFFGIIGGVLPTGISYVLGNEIWFVIGMCMSMFEWKQYLGRRVAMRSAGIFILFIVLSVLAYKAGVQNGFVSLLLGLMACLSIITWFAARYANGKQTVAFGFLARYTMPIFLMHTLFAAPFRILLLKVDIHNAVVHVVVGIGVSFIGPIIAAEVMRKSKWLEFFLYPGKFIKVE